MEAVLNMLCELAQATLKTPDAKIHVPVISDILNDIGVSEFSFLDLFTWIGAVTVNVTHDLVEGNPPFPANDSSVQAIIPAPSWNELAGLFGQHGTAALFSSSSSAAPFAATQLHQEGPISMSTSLQKSVFEGCTCLQASSLWLGTSSQPWRRRTKQETNSSVFPRQSWALSCAAVVAAGDLLVPIDPVESLPFKILSDITSSTVVGSLIVFSGPGQWIFEKLHINSMVIKDARAVGALINGVLVIHGLTATMWHFYELSQKSKSSTRDATIIGEASNMASYISRLAYGFAVNDEEPDSRLIAILAMGAANDLVGALQLTDMGVGKSAFD